MVLLAALTRTELDVMAEQEKEKGNEAFRAGDYEEALEHYNTSIKMNSNKIAYNNRAMTCKKIYFIHFVKKKISVKYDYIFSDIKLRQYKEAISDCNIVLSIEHTNIKALLRRATSLEHLGKLSEVFKYIH